jgi:hypothetical protein
LPRTLISDLPGGFGEFLSRLAASGRCATGAWLMAPVSLPIWSCSVWGLPCLRHYCRSGALLPHLFTLTCRSKRYVFCGTSRPRDLKPASRTLSGTLPCGVRTFLPRQPLLSQGLPAATARSSCQWLVYRENVFARSAFAISQQPALRPTSCRSRSIRAARRGGYSLASSARRKPSNPGMPTGLDACSSGVVAGEFKFQFKFCFRSRFRMRTSL